MSTGMAMPTIAKRMWKPSDMAIWERAARRSVMAGGYGSRCYPSETTTARWVPGADAFRKIRMKPRSPGRASARIGRMAAAIDVPDRFNAATHFLDRHVTEGQGARTAFRFAGRDVTYGEIALRANRLGNALLAHDVQIEQRVVLALRDRPEFAEAFWGAMKIGAVPVPVSDGLPAGELAFLLQDSRARAVIASEAAVPEIRKIGVQCPALESVIVVGGRRRGALEYERLLEKASPELAPADTSRDDVALWLYTSGSTGRPKAAVHLHHDLVYAAELVGRGTFGIAADDVIFSASKLHFAFGLGNSLYFPALVGAASVLVPDRLEAERIFELIQAERPTMLFAVATVYRRLLQVEGAGRQFDLSSLRLCVSSREALPAGIFHAWKSRFGHELLDVVGATEALHDYIAHRPGAARPGASTRRCWRSRWSGAGTPTGSRKPTPSACCAMFRMAPTRSSPSCRRWCASAWPATRRRAGSTSWPSCPRPPPARSSGSPCGGARTRVVVERVSKTYTDRQGRHLVARS